MAHLFDISLIRIAWIICGFFYAVAFHTATSQAQTPIPPITSSGLNTHISDPTSVNGKVQYDITGGTRAGSNLFHSFADFNVPNNNIANFLNDANLTTTNILARVTPGNVSNIFGTIQTTGFDNANLFLMNPSGIVFGPNASLNIGGSVVFTTADYLRFADNGRFNAIPNATSDVILSTAPVLAFGFLGANPGAITIQGSQFATSTGHGISLVGGNITIESGTLEDSTVRSAHLSAPGGKIYLASVSSQGEVPEETFGQYSILTGQSLEEYGNIKVLQSSVIDSSGDGGGRILIRGGHLLIDESRISANVTGPTIRQFIGPNIDIEVTQDAVIRNKAVLETSVDPGVAFGSSGTHIKADRITIRGVPGSIEDFGTVPLTGIISNTQGAGNAGSIVLRATRNIEITNVVSLFSTSGFNSDGTAGSPILATGNAGNVELTSTHGNILLSEGGRAMVVTSQTLNSSGNTGNIVASALEGDIVLNGANLFTALLKDDGGQGGQVLIAAKNLRMDAGLLSNDNFGPLKPGGITVTLSDEMTVAGQSFIVTGSLSPTGTPAGDINLTAKEIAVTQGSLINNGTFSSGPGGQLNITTAKLQITDGGQLDNGSTLAPLFGGIPQGIVPSGAGGTIMITDHGGPTHSVLIDGAGSMIVSNSEGVGAGGNIFVNADSVTLQNGGMVSASTSGTAASSKGGSIIVNATDHIVLSNLAAITASSTGTGNAGNILIDAGRQLDVQNGSIITRADHASGGNIDIRAIDSIRFLNSQISASVGADSGNGGNITIDPNVVILQNSQVLAQAAQGHGGNITITTPVFLQDQASLVDASSQFGVSGTVTIQSPTSNLSGTVTQLPSKPSDTQALLHNRCAALAGGEQSTFIVAGRDTLPSQPGGWLSSPVSMDHFTGEGLEHATGVSAIARVTETEIVSLRRLTPAGFLVRTFANGSTGCHS